MIAPVPQDGRMTPERFRAWRDHLGLTRREAARRLGLDERTLYNYEHGGAAIPVAVELAAAAIAIGVRSYDGPEPPPKPNRPSSNRRNR